MSDELPPDEPPTPPPVGEPPWLQKGVPSQPCRQVSPTAQTNAQPPSAELLKLPPAPLDEPPDEPPSSPSTEQ